MDESFGLHVPISRDLAFLREQVRSFALRSKMSAERVDLLVLAVNEAVTNVLDHAGGRGTLSARHDQSGLTVHVTDEGGALAREHLQLTPAAVADRGMGLWVIRQVCDDVQLDHVNGRSRLRLFMRQDHSTQSGAAVPQADQLSDACGLFRDGHPANDKEVAEDRRGGP